MFPFEKARKMEYFLSHTFLIRRFSTPEKFNVNKERICTAIN
jgi:hypothetical protein